MRAFKYFYLLVTLGVGIFAFHRWFACWQFQDMFYYSGQNLLTDLINALNADRGFPLLITRMWHNKVFGLLWGFTQTMLQYWDIRFLEDFLGIIGAVGVYWAVWYVLTKDRKNLVVWGLLLAAGIVSLIEMYVIPHINYSYRLFAFGIVFELLSLYGVWQFLSQPQKKVRYIVVTLLLLFSVLFLLLFPLSFFSYCLKA